MVFSRVMMGVSITSNLCGSASGMKLIDSLERELTPPVLYRSAGGTSPSLTVTSEVVFVCSELKSVTVAGEGTPSFSWMTSPSTNRLVGRLTSESSRYVGIVRSPLSVDMDDLGYDCAVHGQGWLKYGLILDNRLLTRRVLTMCTSLQKIAKFKNAIMSKTTP